mgnify:CR=1 FL=1
MHNAVLMDMIHSFQHLPPHHAREERVQEGLGHAFHTAAGRARGARVLLSEHLGQVNVARLKDHRNIPLVASHLEIHQLDDAALARLRGRHYGALRCRRYLGGAVGRAEPPQQGDFVRIAIEDGVHVFRIAHLDALVGVDLPIIGANYSVHARAAAFAKHVQTDELSAIELDETRRVR